MRLAGIIYMTLYVGLLSVCSGAAVDAPSVSSISLPAKIEERKKEETHSRIARSVPAPDSVLNFLPIKSDDYESDRYSESQDPWQHQPQLPVRLSQSQSQSQTNPWSLQPQVGKRGSRYRGGAGGQSSYYRAQNSPQLNMLSESLAAVEQGAASTVLSRQQRNGRRYDVPQIGEYHLASWQSCLLGSNRNYNF